MEELIQSIIAELKIELEGDPDFNADILAVKVRNAVRDTMVKRNYSATSFTQEQIVEDLQRYYSVILTVSRYDYNQIGTEGQSSFTESGINRTYVSRDRLFSDVNPFVKVL